MSQPPGGDAATPPHRLLLLRHAKSAWPDDVADHARPLSDRGRRDAGAVGRWLAEADLVPDLVLCSDARRTRQTWDGVSRELSADPEVRYVETVYQAWPDTLLALVRGMPEPVGTLLLVGHAPGVPDLAHRLHQANGDAPLPEFTTSTVAAFAVEGSWADTGPGTARLVAVASPRG